MSEGTAQLYLCVDHTTDANISQSNSQLEPTSRNHTRAAHTITDSAHTSVELPILARYPMALSRLGDSWFNPQQRTLNGVTRRAIKLLTNCTTSCTGCMRRTVISLFLRHSGPVHDDIVLNLRNRNQNHEKNCI